MSGYPDADYRISIVGGIIRFEAKLHDESDYCTFKDFIDSGVYCPSKDAPLLQEAWMLHYFKKPAIDSTQFRTVESWTSIAWR